MDVSVLPVEFLEEMKRILGDEYGDFLASYEKQPEKGLRINTRKVKLCEAEDSPEAAVRDSSGMKASADRLSIRMPGQVPDAPDCFLRETGFHLRRVPWTENGFYYEEEDRPSRHPYYSAGLYYLQEPSAMAPAAVLPVEPGDRVLDLCAAPGGKATELGVRLGGRGLLVANDISAARARVLLRNLELFGIPNACVTNASPERLAERYPAFFDRILVDAPCSGEGMFRKDAAVAAAWYPEKPAECAAVQRRIILKAAEMLRPGGMMLYSTCTFAPDEDERTVLWLLSGHPDMELVPIAREGGRKDFSCGLTVERLSELGYPVESWTGPDGHCEETDLSGTCRLWPHRIEGEGHFLALFRKKESALREKTNDRPELREKADCETALREKTAAGHCSRSWTPGMSGRRIAAEGPGTSAGRRHSGKGGAAGGRGAAHQSDRNGLGEELVREFLSLYLPDCRSGGAALENHDGHFYLMPAGVVREPGIPMLRAGLYLGDLKKDRFEPAQELALVLPGPHAEAGKQEGWEENVSPESRAAVSRQSRAAASPESCTAEASEIHTGVSSDGDTAAVGKTQEDRTREDVQGRYICLPPSDERIEKYLHGYMIPAVQSGANGWRLVCAGEYPIGWGKLVGGQLKNKYPAGWRIPK